MPPSENASLREKLAESLDQAQWDWIKPHADRDRVILVAAELTLLDVGETMARDQVERIGAWIQAGQIGKPTPEQLAQWNAEPTRKFMCLVVDPYVLIQPLQPAAETRVLH